MEKNMTHTVMERFLRYVKIDTQSNPSSPSCPSTEKQKDLGKLLVKELLEIGIEDAHLDEHGYVYATIPANTKKSVPVICFCSHMDTSPDCSGKDVSPIVHENYDGNDIVLPKENQVLKTADHPDLSNQIGHDIITADGTTLLGADNKAGLAAIMNATQYLHKNPDILHGTIKILFTPDEEIGRGPDKANLKKLGADFGYTIDGEKLGSLEDETFSADGVTITINGVSAHPGFAKRKMESAIKIASDIIAALPKESISPETTEGKEGFIHPVTIEGHVEKATIQFIIRDFTNEKLVELETQLEDIVKSVLSRYLSSTYEFKVTEQYRNMKEILNQHPQVIAHAEEAIKRSGIKPLKSSIRGGTDGSRFSFMGLPCPNIFAGEHAFHSKEEWVSVQDMEKAAETIVNLAAIWEEKA
jgi:tripeptide aminopeptidase